MRTRRARVLLLGSTWLAWVWAVALISPRFASDRIGAHAWDPDVEQRATPLARWDSGWYLGLADKGYAAPPTRVGQETNHAFLPLYPLTVGALARSAGLEISRAGNLLSALALIAALPLFAAWIRVRYAARHVEPAVLLLLVFPTSLFFAAVYTESFLLFFALAAVVAVDRDAPWLAIAFGFLAGLTRVAALPLSPYMFLTAYTRYRTEGLHPRGAVLKAAVPGAAPLMGFGSFCLYFWIRFGDPFLFVRAQGNWSGSGPRGLSDLLRTPWRAVRCAGADIFSGLVWREWPARTLEGGFLVLFALLAFLLLRKRQLAEFAYVTLTLGLVLLSGTFESAGRYVLLAFPAFAAAAELLVPHRRALRAVLVLSLLVQAFYVWRFVHWYWVG